MGDLRATAADLDKTEEVQVSKQGPEAVDMLPRKLTGAWFRTQPEDVVDSQVKAPSVALIEKPLAMELRAS